MKVRECKRCEYNKRRAWKQYHEPVNYHPIGMSHVYAYCKYYRKRCSEITKCYRKEKTDEND